MKKLLCVLCVMFLGACSYAQDSVVSVDEGAAAEAGSSMGGVVDKEGSILIIVGEGGPSGQMFIRAAETYKRENGGEIREVHNGDEFVFAMNEFLERKGEIDHLEYFGHGNQVGLYVNQAPNVNGGLYVNDPDLNVDYIAASIYEVPADAFSKWGWIRFNGCNVANGYPDEDNLAQRMANYFEADVVAPMGPTEFSKREGVIDPYLESSYLDSEFSGDVYMVPTYGDGGFVIVRPWELYGDRFTDVRVGHSFAEAVYGLVERGLVIGEAITAMAGSSMGEYRPYENVTYAEAVHFCKVTFGNDAECRVAGYKGGDGIRNLHALKMLVDAYVKISGDVVKWTDPWRDGYIWWANQRGLLGEDFVTKKWWTRGEMAELAWGFVKLL